MNFRRIVCFCCAALFCGAWFLFAQESPLSSRRREDVRPYLEAGLKSAREARAAGATPSGVDAILQKYNIAAASSRYVGGSNIDPAAERGVRIHEIEQWVAPYTEDILFGMQSLREMPESTTTASVQWLVTGPATLEVRAALLEMARTEGVYFEYYAAAFHALFQLGFDDAEVTQLLLSRARPAEVGEQLSSDGDPGLRLLRLAGAQWAVPEVRDRLIDLLRTPCAPTGAGGMRGRNLLMDRYSLAAGSLSRWGLLAEDCAPLLRARLAELSKDREREIGVAKTITECLDRIEGRLPPVREVTWKGKWLGVSKDAWLAWELRQPEAATQNAPSPQADNVLAGNETAGPVPAREDQSSTSSRSLRNWVILGAVVCALAVLFLLLRRRIGGP